MIFEMASSVATKPVRRLVCVLIVNWLAPLHMMSGHARLMTSAIVMAISATHEDKNQMSAGVCSSGFRANNLIFTILIAVQMPPPD